MDRAAEGGHSLIDRLERRLHITLAEASDRRLGVQHTSPNVLLDRYWHGHGANDRLTLLDAILVDMQDRAYAKFDSGEVEPADRIVAAAEDLGAVLKDAGSAWNTHVDAPAWGLVRRVSEATTQLVQAVVEPNTDAARKLRDAWNACYRQNPDPDGAYRKAVLAVEAVSIPLMIPKDPRASLGKVAAHVAQTLSGWTVGRLDAEESASAETLHLMLKTLWHNQERHARSDGVIVDVSQAEAEAAVSLAVTLVHWFSNGLVNRVDGRISTVRP